MSERNAMPANRAAVLEAIHAYTGDWGEPPSHDEVAEIVGLHVGSIPYQVRKLRTAGLLVPGSGPANRRCLRLTHTGHAAAEAIHEAAIRKAREPEKEEGDGEA